MLNHELQARQSGHAPVNGLNMYYEIHGPETGIPLVLLHGGGSTIESTFGKILPMFAASRPVIALEEQAHGRTSDREGPETFEGSADDVAALLEFLAVEKADLLGFSAGAVVALQVAIRHPQQIRKLIFASSMIRRAGVPVQFWEFMKSADLSNMPQPLKDAFLRVNPDEAQLKVMHDKDADRMNNFADIPDALITTMQAPTLIVLGEQDIVKPEHALEMTRLLPNARLLIVPGGHGDYLGDVAATTRETSYPQLVAGIIGEF
ncbi:MAG: alpha/beta hydrolase, partial [Caldilineaceae bacterium]|nr:alpha/beta hydrolase [Caldilineaceae bacterium]